MKNLPAKQQGGDDALFHLGGVAGCGHGLSVEAQTFLRRGGQGVRDHIGEHRNIAAFIDNDDAGRETLQKIMDSASEGAHDVCVYDMSRLYEGYNDLNEKLSDLSNRHP